MQIDDGEAILGNHRVAAPEHAGCVMPAMRQELYLACYRFADRLARSIDHPCDAAHDPARIESGRVATIVRYDRPAPRRRETWELFKELRS
jgi:hypothetical protein